MAIRMWLLCLASVCFLLLPDLSPLSEALIANPGGNNFQQPKAISDLKEAIVKNFGFQADDMKISGFDLRDALVGRSVAYEFNVEMDNQVLPLKLLEDVNRWEYVDLPVFRVEDSSRSDDEHWLVERRTSTDAAPVLAPFQLSGPMELWIQDAKDMRISLPHDVDAGVLKKIILDEGVVVTVKGARSVSLRHPIEFPLPLNQSNSGFASGLLGLARHLCHASNAPGAPLISLRIVGLTSLTSSTSSSSSSANNRLKLKRLAPGLVELSSASKMKAIEEAAPVDLQGEATTYLTPDSFTTLWPLTSINGSNSNLLGFEALLTSVLGPKANKKGSFKLLKADVSAQTFLKIGFGVEKKLKEGDGFNLMGIPEWRTKPETVRTRFEVLAKVDGDKVVPERVLQVNDVELVNSVAPNVLMGNMTMSTTPILEPPPSPFTL